VVYVTDIEASALAAQTARAEGREGALVAQFCQRVGLIHELGELAGAEELTHGGNHRADVNEADRGEIFLVTNGHALFNDAFHTAQANAQFILNQFANSLNAAVAEVINIILVLSLVVDQNHAADEVNDIPGSNIAVRDRNAIHEVELLIELVAAHPLQVIMALVKELFFDECAGIIKGGGIAGAHALEEFDQRSLGNRALLRVPDGFLAQG